MVSNRDSCWKIRVLVDTDKKLNLENEGGENSDKTVTSPALSLLVVNPS